MGDALVAGGLDHGSAMEINPIDMILFAIGITLMAMWLDR